MIFNFTANRKEDEAVRVPLSLGDIYSNHKFAIRDIYRYSGDDEIERERLAPFVAAFESGSLGAMIANRECLEGYCAASSGIDSLLEALRKAVQS